MLHWKSNSIKFAFIHVEIKQIQTNSTGNLKSMYVCREVYLKIMDYYGGRMAPSIDPNGHLFELSLYDE